MNNFETYKKNQQTSRAEGLEKMKRLKPLEQLVMVKSEMVIELEMELLQPNVSRSTKKAIQDRIAKTNHQILQISRLIQSIENQLPPPPAETKINTKNQETTPLPKIDHRPWLSIVLALSIGYGASLINLHKTPAITVAPPPAAVAPIIALPSVPAIKTIEVDANQAFGNQSINASSEFMKNVTDSIKNEISGSTRSVTVRVYSSIRAGSSKSKENLRFHKALTFKRAQAITAKLKKTALFSQITWTPIGMGAENENHGKKVVFSVNE